MKNKNQQIISLLKKEILEQKKTLNESIAWADKFRKENIECLDIIEQLQKQISSLEKQVGGLLEIITNRELPDGFILNPPRMITPENLEDGSIFEDI